MTADSYTPMGEGMPWYLALGGFLGVGAYALFGDADRRERLTREGHRSAAWFKQARRQVATVHAFFAEHPHTRKTRTGRSLARRCRVIEAAIARAKPMPGETP